MGAAFAGIIRVPLTSVMMIFEVTRDYNIIVPLMIANLLSYFIASRLQKSRSTKHCCTRTASICHLVRRPGPKKRCYVCKTQCDRAVSRCLPI